MALCVAVRAYGGGGCGLSGRGTQYLKLRKWSALLSNIELGLEILLWFRWRHKQSAND